MHIINLYFGIVAHQVNFGEGLSRFWIVDSVAWQSPRRGLNLIIFFSQLLVSEWFYEIQYLFDQTGMRSCALYLVYFPIFWFLFHHLNVQSTVQLGFDFLSPESLTEANRLADEIRGLPNDRKTKLQILEVIQPCVSLWLQPLLSEPITS